MSVKVISWGHKIKKRGIAKVFFLFFFSLLCQAFIIISSTSCKHQMPQTSATSTVSGRPPSAPWDICIYFLSPGSHCSPPICWRWLGSCLLGLIAASQSWLLSRNSIYRSLDLIGWSYFSWDFKRWSCYLVNSSISLPFCEHPVCLTVAVNNVSFPRGLLLLLYCPVIVVLWVAFMEQLHCSWFSWGRSDLTHVSALKRPPVQGNQQPPPSWGSVVLGPRTLINQSTLVYADANTAKLSPCPYQLKQSNGQSIILGVTQHVAKVACAQNVHLSV